MADAVRLGEAAQCAAEAQRGLGQVGILREVEEGGAHVLAVVEPLLGKRGGVECGKELVVGEGVHDGWVHW